MGPWLITPDEFDDPNDLKLGCSINGEHSMNPMPTRVLNPTTNARYTLVMRSSLSGDEDQGPEGQQNTYPADVPV